MDESKLDALVNALRRPMAVYTYAYGTAQTPTTGDKRYDGHVKGAQTRLENARKEIDSIVREYTKE